MLCLLVIRLKYCSIEQASLAEDTNQGTEPTELPRLDQLNTCRRLLEDLCPLDFLADRLDACILNDEELKDRASRQTGSSKV